MTAPPRWTDHRAQLARVTAHIHDRLTEPLDLDELAVVADLSPFHWHRIHHRGSCMRIGKAFETARIHKAGKGLMRPDTRRLAQYLDGPFACHEECLHSPRDTAPVDLLTDICLPLAASTEVGSA